VLHVVLKRFIPKPLRATHSWARQVSSVVLPAVSILALFSVHQSIRGGQNNSLKKKIKLSFIPVSLKLGHDAGGEHVDELSEEIAGFCFCFHYSLRQWR
jgi:hypothetical protein